MRRLLVTLITLAGAISCAPTRAPAAPVQPSPLPRALPPEPGPLRISFVRPAALAPFRPDVAIVFGRPMRALAPFVPGRDNPPLLLMTDGRPVPGSWQWEDSRTAQFVPIEALPGASSFTIVADTAARSLDGAALASAFSYAFTTPLPTLLSSSPSDGQREVEPDTTISLIFNQRVDPQELARTAVLRADSSDRALAYDTGAGDASGTTLLVTPREPLPVDTRVTLSIDATLHSPQGPLPSGREQTLSFETIKPVQARFVCERDETARSCPEDSSIYVVLSRSVKLGALRKHLRVDGGCRWLVSRREKPDADIDRVYVADTDRGETCSLVLRAGLRDERGLTVARDQHDAMAITSPATRLRWGLYGAVLEPLWIRREVTFAAQEIDAFDLLSAPLPEPRFAAMLCAHGTGDRSWWAASSESASSSLDFDRLASLPGAHTWQMQRPTADAARWVAGRPASEVLGGRGERRIVVTRYRSPGGPRVDWRLTQVTDLALHASLSPFGSLVWVTRLSHGSPVAGAKIAASNVDGHETPLGATNADGVLEIPQSAYRPASPAGRVAEDSVLVASKDGDSVVETLVQTPVRPEQAWLPALSPAGIVFTDRGIYRRGEVAHVAGFARYRSATGAVAPPAGTPLSVEALDFDGNTFYSGKVVTDGWGRFAADIAVTGAVGFGHARVIVRLDGPDGPPKSAYWSLAQTGFDVGAPRVPVHEADASVEHASYIQGDTSVWSLSARYLFGGEMRGCEASYSVIAAPTSPGVPVESSFTLQDSYPLDGKDASAASSFAITHGKVTLDRQGHASVSVPLSGFALTRPAYVTFSADVQEASRQTVRASATTMLHPAPVYVALRSPGYEPVVPGSAYRAEAKVVDIHGAQRAGYPVRLELYRRTIVRHPQTARQQAREEIKDTFVSACGRTSAADNTVACDLRPPSEGEYVVRASTTLEGGKVVAASAELRAARPKHAEEPPPAPEPDSFSWRIDDEKDYQPGSSVELRVHAPVAVDGLVTVSNGGLLYWRRTRFQGDSILQLPVSEAMAPRATLRVETVAGRTEQPDETGWEHGAPVHQVDERSFRVADLRKLVVEVSTPKSDYAVEEHVDVRVKVADERGAPQQAAIVLYAVDEGELELTAYRTPDPFDSFRDWYDAGVWTRSSMEVPGGLRDLRRASHYAKPPSVRMGATSAGEPRLSLLPPRDRFVPTPYFSTDIVTDADGRAAASFRLPQQLTAFRIMAVAATKTERAGSDDTRITVHQPLMLRAALPRFLREGDQADAGVVVATRAAMPEPVKLTIDAPGVVIDGPLTRTVIVAPDGNTEVRFPIRAQAAGTAALTFRARAGAYQDALKALIEVSRAEQADVAVTTGQTTQTAREALGAIGAVRSDVGGLEVSLTANPYDQAGQAIRELVEYPYGCAEQRSSSLVGSVVARRWAAVSSLAPLEAMAEAEQQALGGLVGLQRGNGSFGYWTSSRQDVGLTAYVLLVVGEMERQGLPRLEGSAVRSARFLEKWLADTPLGDSRNLSSAALALDALSLHGPVKPELAERVMAARERMSCGSAALLAHAMRDDPMRRERAWDQLRRLVEPHLRMIGPDAMYVSDDDSEAADWLSSDARTTAMVLRTLARRPSRDEWTARLANGLLALRRGATWGSTQANAWSVLALESARKVVAPPEFPRPVRVLLGDKELGQATLTQDSPTVLLTVPMAGLLATRQSAVQIETTSGGPLSYSVLLRYAESGPARAVNHGFAVQRRLRTVADGHAVSAGAPVDAHGQVHLPLGEMAVVDVIVQAPDRRAQVVIDDPLPAGLEAVDPGLATSPQYVEQGFPAVRAATLQELNAADGQSLGPVRTHKEIHPDRVLIFVDDMPAGAYRFETLVRATTAGRFVHPPAKAEAMYAPGLWGRTAVSRVVVEGR